MSTKIDYFGDFTAELVLFEDRLKYMEEAGIKVLSKEPYDVVLGDEKTFLVTIKVNSITLLELYSAGCRDGINKCYNHK